MVRKKFYQQPTGLFFGGAIILVIVLVAVQRIPIASGGQYDRFAQCVTQSGAKMYGAYWCPHCKTQKEMFGGSWRYIDYIECAVGQNGQSPICANAGVTSYPTWELGDGQRINGTISLEQLAERTGCELKKDEP